MGNVRRRNTGRNDSRMDPHRRRNQSRIARQTREENNQLGRPHVRVERLSNVTKSQGNGETTQVISFYSINTKSIVHNGKADSRYRPALLW